MSNLATRVLVAVAAVPVIVGITYVGGFWFFFFVAFISTLALREFYGLAQTKGATPNIGLGILGGLFINLSFFHAKLQHFLLNLFDSWHIALPFPTQTQLFLIIVVLFTAAVCLAELFRARGQAILNVATTVSGVMYVSVFLGTLIGLREVFVPLDFPMLRYFPNESSFMDPHLTAEVYRWGGYTVISLFATIWLCDTAAYHAGVSWGKHKLFPRVSPSKTWEGAIAGFIVAIAVALTAQIFFLSYLSIGNALIIGLIVGIFGQAGDLAESLLKRDAGVKDSSSIIPGHGGILDRFDSLIFVSPLVYLYIDYILFS